MSKPVRVRFAPSPTGYLHVGSIRSGLFNWLWARHNGGVSIVRIEDTDRKRLVEGAINQINASMDALGISPDEGPQQGGAYGPYIQSERRQLYLNHAETLLKTGNLYRCWCSSEHLDDMRAAAQAAGEAFRYDRHCLIPENAKSSAEPHVLRFKIPEMPAVVTWDDAVRGRMEFKIGELDDFVAIKADGYPTYHFANVVDDHLMEISHVLRADEWLPSTPKHLLMFVAFDWEAPVYAHLPAVLGPSGNKKLSKRDGAQSVQEYIDEGFLPEALRSFLASLGWNDGTTQEVYSTDELIKHFSLERIQRSPAKFDRERLVWVNGLMIRQMPLEQLLDRTELFWPAEAASRSRQYRLQVLGLVQERLKFLSEITELTSFFFTEPAISAELISAESVPLLQAAIACLNDSDFTEDDLEKRLRSLATRLDVKPGILFAALRLAVTGKKAAPGIFETLHTLGHDTSLKRLGFASEASNR